MYNKQIKMIQKEYLEDMMKCAWKEMSENRLSTTFEDVKELDLNHPLWFK